MVEAEVRLRRTLVRNHQEVVLTSELRSATASAPYLWNRGGFWISLAPNAFGANRLLTRGNRDQEIPPTAEVLTSGATSACEKHEE